MVVEDQIMINTYGKIQLMFKRKTVNNQSMS